MISGNIDIRLVFIFSAQRQYTAVLKMRTPLKKLSLHYNSLIQCTLFILTREITFLFSGRGRYRTDTDCKGYAWWRCGQIRFLGILTLIRHGFSKMFILFRVDCCWRWSDWGEQYQCWGENSKWCAQDTTGARLSMNGSNGELIDYLLVLGQKSLRNWAMSMQCSVASGVLEQFFKI